MNPSATGERPRQTQNGGSRRGEGRGGLSLRVLRIQAKRSCRVLVMAKKGRNGGTKEGRKEGRHFGRRRRAGHISGCRSHLRFFSSSDRPCHANSRRDLLSQGVLQPFPKNKKYSHSTCQLKGERNMYVKSTDGKLITLIQEWTVRTTVRTVTVSGKTHSPDTPSR